MNKPMNIRASDEIKELKLKTDYLDVISVFANQLLKFKTVDEVLWGIIKYAIAKLNYEDCIVYLYDYDLNSFCAKELHMDLKNQEILRY